jgi:hypothetical protein
MYSSVSRAVSRIAPAGRQWRAARSGRPEGCARRPKGAQFAPMPSQRGVQPVASANSAQPPGTGCAARFATGQIGRAQTCADSIAPSATTERRAISTDALQRNAHARHAEGAPLARDGLRGQIRRQSDPAVPLKPCRFPPHQTRSRPPRPPSPPGAQNCSAPDSASLPHNRSFTFASRSWRKRPDLRRMDALIRHEGLGPVSLRRRETRNGLRPRGFRSS